jgi:hypothetical protein
VLLELTGGVFRVDDDHYVLAQPNPHRRLVRRSSDPPPPPLATHHVALHLAGENDLCVLTGDSRSTVRLSAAQLQVRCTASDHRDGGMWRGHVEPSSTVRTSRASRRTQQAPAPAGTPTGVV